MTDLVYDWKEGLLKVHSLALEEEYGEASQIALEILKNVANNREEGMGSVQIVDVPKDIVKELQRFYVHSSFHAVDSGDMDTVSKALEFIRVCRKTTTSEEESSYQYVAEEAYCLYRLKQYETAGQICEAALHVSWTDDDDIELASTRDLVAASSASDFLALAHVYAQTLYHLQKPKASISMYQAILQHHQSCVENKVPVLLLEDEEEHLANIVAVYCSLMDPNTTHKLRPTREEIFMDLYGTNKKISDIMDLKHNNKGSLSSLTGNSTCLDLSYNIATLLAMYSNHFQDIEVRTKNYGLRNVPLPFGSHFTNRLLMAFSLSFTFCQKYPCFSMKNTAFSINFSSSAANY